MQMRAHDRFKDDRRVCRATLEDGGGKSVKLSVIDISAEGAALTGVKDTSTSPRIRKKPLTQGRMKISVPSMGKRDGTKIIDVGDYEVVREWPRGLGDDAGLAVTFPKPRKAWVEHVADERFPLSLA
jgi:hypothetical protein